MTSRPSVRPCARPPCGGRRLALPAYPAPRDLRELRGGGNIRAEPGRRSTSGNAWIRSAEHISARRARFRCSDPGELCLPHLYRIDRAQQIGPDLNDANWNGGIPPRLRRANRATRVGPRLCTTRAGPRDSAPARARARAGCERLRATVRRCPTTRSPWLRRWIGRRVGSGDRNSSGVLCQVR